jgi:hypothetical protein
VSRKIAGNLSVLGFGVAAALMVVFVGAPGAFAQSATVQTDRPDYAPGEMAVITGAGFQAGETVTLQVVHIDGTPEGGAGHDPWDWIADADGGISTGWLVDPDDSEGSTFRLTAVGATSGLTAETTFTDTLPPGGPPVLPAVTCPSNLNSCTANDVKTTVVAVAILNNDICNSLTDTLDVRITAAFESTASNRYDVGVFISRDGGTVQEPSSALLCTGAAPQVGAGDPNSYPDSDTDLFLNQEGNHPDTCGDINSNLGPIQWTFDTTVTCNIVQVNGQGQLVIPSCRVWEQNQNTDCTSLTQAGTGSKCDCTDLIVTTQLNPCATTICNDNNACTDDSCVNNAGVAQCVYTNDTTNSCSDGDACTADACVIGQNNVAQCVGTPNVVCNDDNACTSDACNPANGSCVYTNLAAGTSCGSNADTDCDNPDTCNGQGSCVPNYEPATTVCRADAGQCDVAEFCDGAGACPADVFEPTSKVCSGASNGDACDATDHCSGTANTCVDEYQASSFSCRADAGQCDVEEFCTGTSGACPPDGFEGSNVVCTGASNGDACDATDHCSGTANTCVDEYQSVNFSCRADAGQCDVEEFCTGTSGACPPDGFEGSNVVCTGASNGDACDATDHCSGSANTCIDEYQASSFSCRADAGQCDVEEFCTGNSGACPPDAFEANTVVCTGASNGDACDATDHCSGSANTCIDEYQSANYECRAAAGVCDVEEFCTGNSGACPPDAFEPSSAVCRTDSGLCDVAENCTGNSAECPANTREECAVVTTSSICTFDVTDSCQGTGREFKLIYTPDTKVWVGYKLNGTNPGQFYYNLFAEGATSVTVQIPWPFVTQGAMPVHVYDAGDVTTTDTCLVYPPGGEAFDLTITVADRLNGKNSGGANGGWVSCPDTSGLPGPPPSPDDICTIQIPLPSTDGHFVAIHLDYGFKGLNVDANPQDTLADRYDRAINSNALVNTTDNTSGAVAIPNCYPHNFCHAAGDGGEEGCDLTDVVLNANEFKKIAGVFGRLTDPVGGGLQGHINLFRPSTGQVVAQGDTDADGYYMVVYKHIGSPETYEVRMTSTSPGYPGTATANVVLKANGWAEANFGWDDTTLTWVVLP